MIVGDYGPLKENNSNKDLKLKNIRSNENRDFLWKIDKNAKYYRPEGFY